MCMINFFIDDFLLLLLLLFVKLQNLNSNSFIHPYVRRYWPVAIIHFD